MQKKKRFKTISENCVSSQILICTDSCLVMPLYTIAFLPRIRVFCVRFCVRFLLFLLAFSSGTVQECGDNPSLSSAHSSCCHRCPRTGVCSLHVVHTVLLGVEAPSHSLQYSLCADFAAGLRINIASFFCNVRRCSRVHILVLECALCACWGRLIPTRPTSLIVRRRVLPVH